MREWTEFFKKSVIEGFGNFIWPVNSNISYPFTYTPKTLLEDQLNLYSDHNKAALKFKESKNDK